MLEALNPVSPVSYRPKISFAWSAWLPPTVSRRRCGNHVFVLDRPTPVVPFSLLLVQGYLITYNVTNLKKGTLTIVSLLGYQVE